MISWQSLKWITRAERKFHSSSSSETQDSARVQRHRGRQRTIVALTSFFLSSCFPLSFLWVSSSSFLFHQPHPLSPPPPSHPSFPPPLRSLSSENFLRFPLVRVSTISCTTSAPAGCHLGVHYDAVQEPFINKIASISQSHKRTGRSIRSLATRHRGKPSGNSSHSFLRLVRISPASSTPLPKERQPGF